MSAYNDGLSDDDDTPSRESEEMRLQSQKSTSKKGMSRLELGAWCVGGIFGVYALSDLLRGVAEVKAASNAYFDDSDEE